MYDNDLNRAIDRYFNQKNRQDVNNAASSSSVQIHDVEAMDTNEPGPSRRRPVRRAHANAIRNIHPVPSAPYAFLLKFN